MRAQQPYACPRCNSWLESRAACLPMSACMSCGGLWLAERDAQRLQHNFSRAGHQLADRIGNEAPNIVCTRASDIPCPVCRRPMHRAVAQSTWVEVDWCPGHGSWFDRGELQRIAHSYHGCLSPSESSVSSSNHSSLTPLQQDLAETGVELAIGLVFAIIEGALDS